MTNYNKTKKDDLKNLCKERGLDDSGTTDALKARLSEFDISNVKTKDMFAQEQETKYEVNPKKTGKPIAKDNFFLQIKSANLSNYFNFGYIYPLALEESEIYKNENRAKDILSAFEDYIVIGKAPFNQFQDTDVLIELILDGIQITNAENNSIYYISQPIPISRVKAVYFKSTTARSTFVSSVKTFPDIFIPSAMCKIISSVNEKSVKCDFDKIKLPKNQLLYSWREKMDLFDKILGLFAFIKNTGVLYAERENKFENYTPGFLGALTIINPIKELGNYKENTFLKPLLQYKNIEISNAQRVIFKLVIERVYQNEGFDIKTAINILEKSIANEHLKEGERADIKEQVELFKQLDKLTISYKGLLLKEVIRKNLPTLALLFLSRFANKSRQNTDKQSVRISFIDNEFGLSINVAEYILGFLGLYYGYKNMIKEDTNLKFSDKNFEQLSTSNQSIKFKLESYLDRFIIESAFQFAVKQSVLNDSFEFLNWGDGLNETKPINIASSFQYDYFDQSFSILGQPILKTQRFDKTEKMFERIASQYSDKVEDSSYLVAFIKKYISFDKWILIDLLKRNKSSYPLDELDKIIDLDNKTKKNNK